MPSGVTLILTASGRGEQSPSRARSQGFRELPPDDNSFVDRDHATGDSLRERRPFHQLEHEATDAVRFFQSVDRTDVRMVQRSEQPRLTLEASEPVSVGGDVRWQEFDCDVTPEIRVPRAINLTHAPGTSADRI